jgi:tetratricopeptide (TPR) repeat protein
MIDHMPRLAYRSNRRRAQITVIALGVCALISAMIIVHSLTAIELFQRLERGDFTLAEAITLDERTRTLALFDVVAYLVTAIIFLFWIHRAYKNHEQLARHGTEYSPNWAAFGFLIPIVSLVRPYQVVREMWDETQAGAREDPLRATPSHTIVIVWWLAFLAMNFIARLFSTAANTADTAAELTSAVTIDIVVQVITIVSAVLAIRIVQGIDIYHETQQRQAQPADTLTDQPGWTPLVYAWSIGLGMIVLGVVLFGSNVVVDQIDQVIASAPTAVPTRRAAASQSSKSKPTTTPGNRPTSVLAPSEHEERGKEYLDAGDYDQALEAFSQALKSDPTNARLHYLRGVTYTWLEDYDNALIDLNRAIKLTPKYTEAYYERGMAHLNLGNYGLAGEDFDQALKLDAEYADAYIGRGWMHYLLDEYADALKDADQAIQLDKRAADAFHVRGLIHLDTGKFDQAIADFSEAIKLEPESASAFNRRGLAYYGAGDLDKALQDYDQALKLEPEYIDVHYNRGLLNYNRGAYQAALSDLTAVIKHYPKYGPAYLYRGATYGQLKEYDKAIADVERALDLELSASDRADAEQLLEDLKAARKGTSS